MKFIDLLREMGFGNPNDVCINVHSQNFDYPLAFIEAETKEKLVISVTDESGRERMRILNKKYVEAIDIVYQDEIKLENTGKSNRDRMFN